MVERSIRIRQVGGSMPPTSTADKKKRKKKDVVTEWLTCLTRNQILSGAQVQILPTSLSLLPNWRNGSAPAYGAGGCGFEPHVGLCCFFYFFSCCSRSSVGRSSASHAEGPGFDPLRELGCIFLIVFSRKVERSIRPENLSLFFLLFSFSTHVSFVSDMV